MAYFLVFEVFISAKCVYRMYLTYFLLNLSNKRNLPFFIFWDFFWLYCKYPAISLYFSLKNKTNFQKSDCIYGFLVYGMFFALFLGISSDKFHYKSVSSKRAMIFWYIFKTYKFPLRILDTIIRFLRSFLTSLRL